MKKQYSNLLKELRHIPTDKGKISYFEVFYAFKKVYGKTYSSQELEAELNRILQQMSKENVIKLQITKKWDYTTPIPRPHWIKMVKSKPTNKLISWKNVIWIPQLGWVSKAKIKKEKTYQDLWCINEFLKSTTLTESLPEKERSLQIFGNEKKLRELNQKFEKYCNLFELVYSYSTHEPLTYRDFHNGQNIAIIIENRDTYDSFCRINEEFETPFYRYVIYGNGIKILVTYDDILTFSHTPEMIEYFGDLDPTGIFIAQQLGKKMIEQNLPFQLKFKPFYKQLVKEYQRQNWEFPFERQLNPYNLDFIPQNERKFISSLFEKSLRIPQELLNKSKIRKLFEVSNVG